MMVKAARPALNAGQPSGSTEHERRFIFAAGHAAPIFQWKNTKTSWTGFWKPGWGMCRATGYDVGQCIVLSSQ
ncbi:MAG: hypothetical protein SWH68_06500 [Thermodesulfobacteriota bacterium]|nr:hypothetical protein [Thermodesulfobacteriota bacterium]